MRRSAPSRRQVQRFNSAACRFRCGLAVIVGLVGVTALVPLVYLQEAASPRAVVAHVAADRREPAQGPPTIKQHDHARDADRAATLHELVTSQCIARKLLLASDAHAAEEDDDHFLQRHRLATDAAHAARRGDRRSWSMYMPAAQRPLPIFLSPGDRETYMASPEHQKLLTSEKRPVPGRECLSNFVGPADQLAEIYVLRNVRFDDVLCGWGAATRDAYHENVTSAPGDLVLPAAALGLAPQSFSFQHALDNVLPKIAAAWPLVRRYPIIVDRFTHPHVAAVWHHLGLTTHPRPAPPSAVYASELLTSCRVPAFNPYSFAALNALLAHRFVARSLLEPPATRVLYFPRGSGATNGRPVANEADLVDALRARFGPALIVFDPAIHGVSGGQDEPCALVGLLATVRVVLGAHGGAFYNLLFSPRTDTVVIEVMPHGYSHQGSDALYWILAQLGMAFVRTYPAATSDDRSFSITVDVPRMVEAVADGLAGKITPNVCEPPVPWTAPAD